MKNSNELKEKLILIFHQKKVMTMTEIKTVLNTNSRMTAHRKLSTVDYISSYSHAGKYYSLNLIAKYNRSGLWEFNGIYFSIHGTLSKTIEYLINHSSAGYFASELQDKLNVFVHNELLKLFRHNKIQREQIGSEFLYFSITSAEVQLKNRKEQIQQALQEDFSQYGFGSSEIGCLQTLLSVLNEQQRRLILGFESLKIGHGGDTILSKLMGVDVRTISKGRKELLAHEILTDGVRAKGGGRPNLKKKLN